MVWSFLFFVLFKICVCYMWVQREQKHVLNRTKKILNKKRKRLQHNILVKHHICLAETSIIVISKMWHIHCIQVLDHSISFLHIYLPSNMWSLKQHPLKEMWFLYKWGIYLSFKIYAIFILCAHVVKAHKAREFCRNFYNNKKSATRHQRKTYFKQALIPEIEILPTKTLFSF